ncbi:topology modulation protein [Planococcus sp. CP5-4]|uniref:topology modulation protein n=1 Tax=unclassified Planococcus (in: firmicutes) TaxID=2662419 RepID=UPI001C24C007|nr:MULTISPECIES: topology modulation protein [unclassified Planococcus (in: firmicutes)]MBU9672412.1 topology modulation protein [Planococcus sp. CP5-4_YE]MBV0909463.1 topology modulation protein [Planococcus sp. CP5-4_UN]MBW6064192.1 topology modulation protein [Planococcus sp. CP5-4]
MRRVMVIGVSAGAGKSTFGRRLGEVAELPVHHLDAYFWEPGWVEAEEREFRHKQQELANEPSWIIEGNYNSTAAIRLAACDTLIQLQLPLWRCLWRVLKRRLQYRRQARPDMAPGCPEKLDYEFLKFIMTTYHERQKSQHHLIEEFIRKYPEKQVYILRTQKEIEAFFGTSR